MSHANQLAEALQSVALEIRELRQQKKSEFAWFRSHFEFATKSDLKEMEKRIMSAISEFAAKQKAFNERQAAAIDGAVASITGLTGDVKTLNDKITELQNSGGGVTPEDQALIDDLQAQGDALAVKSEALSTALAALDAQTPVPVPPVV